MLKEPGLFVDCAPEPVYYINDRIELEKDDQALIMDHIDVPEYRRCPHPYLEDYIDDLSQVPEEYDYRAGRIAKGQHKDKHTEAVIDYLYGIYARIIAVAY